MNFISFVVVFLVIPTTSAFNSTQLDISFTYTKDNINGSSHVDNTCLEFKPQSCSGVCGQFFALWCSCDEYCFIYGRCCFDYESVCKEESEKSRQDHENLMNVTIECDSKISGNNVPQQIITSCSLTNVSLKMVELCEEETRSSVAVSKVMSKRTELHYKNRHCMLCNGEDEDDIVYWSTMMGSYGSNARSNSINSILTLFRNSVKTFIPPPNSIEIICFPRMISFCVPYATQEEQRLCVENAHSPIRYRFSIYKNTYCLQCNDILEPTDDICYPAERKDVFFLTNYELPFTFSMVFNWKKNRKSVVFIDSQMSWIQKMSCSFDDTDNLKECKVIQCFGTLPIVNNTCQLVTNHFGCIQYIFKINFTVPSYSSRETKLGVERISSQLVQVAASFERMYNVTKYYSQNVTLYNITIVDDQISGIIVLNRMAYSLCYSQYRYVSPSLYYEYLETNLTINLNGSISTKRYTVACHDWCSIFNDSDVPIEVNLNYQRSFTGNTEMGLDRTSSVTNFTPIPMCLVSMIGIMVTRLA